MTQPKVRLFIERYHERDPLRANEFSTALRVNCDNPHIDEVHVFQSLPSVAHIAPHHPKLIQHGAPERCTFGDLLRDADFLSAPGDIIILANADIAFDATAERLRSIAPSEAWALTRWDADTWGQWTITQGLDSQDAWVLRAPLKPVTAPFFFGVPGCDNRFARLLADAGYRVTNPCWSITTLHLHASQKRTYTRADTVPGPYLLVPPQRLNNRGGPLRIVHVALIGVVGPCHALQRGLEEIGPTVVFDWRKQLEKHGAAGLQLSLLDTVEAHQADLVFCQLQTAGVLTADTVKRFGCPSVNWTGDVRQPTPQWFYDLADAFTLTAFSNTTDVQALRDAGKRAVYLQIGFDPQRYRPVGPVEEGGPEIVFMGHNYKTMFPLSPWREQMVEELHARYGARFGTYGSYYGSRDELHTQPEREAAVYRGAKIAINASNFLLPRYSSDRMLRIMGCGTLCLTHRFPDMGLEFTDGTHVVGWDTFDDLFRQIDYYLDHEDERKAIAAAGCEHVHATATWPVRLKEMRGFLHV